MKKWRSQNGRLDKIGRELLEASKKGDDEIEDIVAGPHVFRSVKMRIEAERADHLKKGFFKTGAGIRAWNWRLSLVAYGFVFVALTVAIGLGISTKKASPPERVSVPVHNDPDRIFTSGRNVALPPVDEIHNAGTANGPPVQRAVLKPRARETEPRQRVITEEVGEFQPLTYTDGKDGEQDGGQIVRVELPRSSLVAMGVDVPSENRADRLKTDLLFGSDGVMKAVRLVK